MIAEETRASHALSSAKIMADFSEPSMNPGLSLFFCNLDFGGEPYPENALWQWVLSVAATSRFLGGLRKLEDHVESGLVR